MDKVLRELWWVPLVRGISSIVFGILLLVWPAATIGVVAIIFASLLAIYGVLDIVTGIRNIAESPIGFLQILLGFLEVGIVVYLYRNAGSGLTLALMGLLMAVALVVLGLVMISSAFVSDVSAGYRWALGLTGMITLFVGISVARAPAISIASVIYILGIFGLIVGPIEIATAFMAKNLGKETS